MRVLDGPVEQWGRLHRSFVSSLSGCIALLGGADVFTCIQRQLITS
jgi:hypothetical protein